VIDQRPWTPLHIASTSRTKDLGQWVWAPLGRAWALQRRKQLGIGLVVVALTGFHEGRPWCRSDDRRAIDDDAVWLRGLVDGGGGAGTASAGRGVGVGVRVRYPVDGERGGGVAPAPLTATCGFRAWEATWEAQAPPTGNDCYCRARGLRPADDIIYGNQRVDADRER
jgi:hypothetical protein